MYSLKPTSGVSMQPERTIHTIITHTFNSHHPQIMTTGYPLAKFHSIYLNKIGRCTDQLLTCTKIISIAILQ